MMPHMIHGALHRTGAVLQSAVHPSRKASQETDATFGDWPGDVNGTALTMKKPVQVPISSREWPFSSVFARKVSMATRTSSHTLSSLHDAAAARICCRALRIVRVGLRPVNGFATLGRVATCMQAAAMVLSALKAIRC